MHHHRLRRARLWLGMLISITGLLAATAGPVAAGGTLPGSFGGDAYGTFANATAGDIATQLGRSAHLPCPCLGTDGDVHTNTVDTVKAGDAFRAATVETSAYAEKFANMSARVRMTATVEDVRALDGLIMADLIEARATVDATTGNLSATPNGSRFVGLTIDGRAIATVSQGQRIELPGFGFVKLNNVKRYGDGENRLGIRVEMMRISITRQNSLDIPVGTKIIVAQAEAAYDRDDPIGFAGGAAWASDATSSVATVENRFGKSAAEYFGCLGSGDVYRSNNVETVNVPGLLDTATGLTTLKGHVDSNDILARGISRLENVDLLDGFLRADVIKGVARTTYTPAGGGAASFDGSSFVNLRILGVAIGDDVAPNTRIDVAGVGYLILFETASSADADGSRAAVTMVHLYVDTANLLGLPVGTEVRLAFARTYTLAS